MNFFGKVTSTASRYLRLIISEVGNNRWHRVDMNTLYHAVKKNETSLVIYLECGSSSELTVCLRTTLELEGMINSLRDDIQMTCLCL